MADLQATYRQIATIKRSIADEQAQRDDWAGTLPDMIAMLSTETGAALEEVKAAKAETEATIATYDKKIASLRNELSSLEERIPKKPEPVAPKFDPEKHPLLRKTVEKSEPAKPVIFHAGDICEVLWFKDKAWYKAKVQTVLGSASNPKYLVRFVEYDDTVTVGLDDIRPIESKKRKAEAPPTPAPTPVVNSPHVISGPASINPDALAAQKPAGPDTSVPVNRRAIGSKKALERKAGAWNSFLTKGAGKQVGKKESMFRSGTTVGSKVGFTGSGAPMTSNNKRQRFNKKEYQDDDNEGNSYRTDR